MSIAPNVPPSSNCKGLSYFRNKYEFYKSLEQTAKKYSYSNKGKGVLGGSQKIGKSKQGKGSYDSLMRKIMNELFEAESSSVAKQVLMEGSKKQELVQDFAHRQAFLARQSKVLKQMQQFSEYGMIRPGFH